MKNTLLKLIFAFFIITPSINAQITTDPIFPVSNSEVVIYFHADLGNKQLMNYSGDIYAHTGVITNKSTSPSDWKYVITEWSENTSKNKLTKVSTNLYSLTITPSIKEFYGVPEDEVIKELAFVFRNSDGSKQGKTAENEDIFYKVYNGEVATKIINPNPQNIVKLNDQFEINIASTGSDSLKLFIDDILISKSTEFNIEYTYTATELGKKTIKAIAYYNNGEFVIDSTWFYVKTQTQYLSLPNGLKEGINYIDDNTVTLALFAPYKSDVFVIGDFNHWDFASDDNTSYQLIKDIDKNIFWITLENLEAGKEYAFQYLIDGSLRIADPYTEKVLDPWNDKYIPNETYPNLREYPYENTSQIVSTFQTAQTEYNWENKDFTAPDKKDLIIYELLLRDFTVGPEGKEGNIDGLLSKLDYLEALGVNAIELMPFNEFEGNDSWGYNPSFYFAPDKAYGTEEDYKKLIDTLHGRGFAVIMDIVLNHSFGQSPMVRMYFENGKPSGLNPWFNMDPKHDYNVGYDFNHESEATKNFSSNVLKYWLEEYKIDGYRFDLSKGLTQNNTLGDVGAWGQYDASRVSILKAYADTIWSVNPDAYVIFEHFADNSEEKVLANYGMMLWANNNHAYNEATMGWNHSSDLSNISYKKKGWDNPHAVGYMESHDEERLMVKNRAYGNSTDVYSVQSYHIAIDRIMLGANFFFTVPGPKMIWQFGEMAYDYSIDHNGRTGKKPVHWEYLDNGKRYQLVQVFQILNKLRKEEPVFQTENFTMNVGNYAMKSIKLEHESMDAVILGNFDVYEGEINPNFSQTGTWYEYYSGESIEVSDVNAEITLKAGEYRIYTTKQLPVPEIILDVEDIEIASENLKFEIYPNPAYNELNILGVRNINKIEVFDITGKKIFEKAMQVDDQVKVDITGLNPGLYLVRGVAAGGNVINAKFLKQQ